MPDFRERLGDTDLIRFYDYWVSLRGDRTMPARTDVEPLHIPPEFLPNLMLIDVLHAPRRYRYRLIGTQVVAASGEDRTGPDFRERRLYQGPSCCPRTVQLRCRERPAVALA